VSLELDLDPSQRGLGVKTPPPPSAAQAGGRMKHFLSIFSLEGACAPFVSNMV
jgi:hypothetical protein